MKKKLSDIFVVLITDKKAIPYGVTAQRAIYQGQNKSAIKIALFLYL